MSPRVARRGGLRAKGLKEVELLRAPGSLTECAKGIMMSFSSGRPFSLYETSGLTLASFPRCRGQRIEDFKRVDGRTVFVSGDSRGRRRDRPSGRRRDA